jgi:hypothetical protein
MVCSSNGEDTALSRQRCEFDSRTDYEEYWKVAEWLKAADCKSALVRVRGFESLPSNKMVRSSNGEDTALSRQRCEFDSRTDYNK